MTEPSQLIEGEEVNIGGRKLIVPALTLRQIKNLKDKIQSLSRVDPTDEASQNAFLDVVHAALSRNYPDMKREDLDDLIDLRNAPIITRAIINSSGFARSGEVKAG